ncbi:MAG: alpha/beta hydrolase [Chloroflexota bacterium]
MIFVRWFLILLISMPIMAYLAYVVLFYTQQRRLLFPAQTREVVIADPTVYDGLVAARFDTQLGSNAGFAWYLPPPVSNSPAPAVIIGHGNGEIADDWVGFADALRRKGYGVLILGYPGYGHAAGSPSKESIVDSAVQAYDWLVNQPEIDGNKVIIFGHSVGGGATLALAEQRPTQGAILLSTFTSINQIARDRYLPGFLARDKFDNLNIIKSYDQPVYLMHGTLDTLIPPYHAELLLNGANQSQLRWLQCGHGGCIGDIEVFWDDLQPIMQNMISN